VKTVDAVEALRSGSGFVDLSFWRKIEVSGADAEAWLNDPVSADISGLATGRARRSLLLSPTGGMRAEFTIAARNGSFLLVQDPSQPDAVDSLLGRYVLSSDVGLVDRTEDLALFAFPGRESGPEVDGAETSSPSPVGAGVDLIAPASKHADLLRALSNRYTAAGNESLETWRIASGIPRFSVDATAQDLPAEAGFDDALSYEKGCYLGQEAVARVRNLGHPRRTLVHVAAERPVAAGDQVESGGVEVGRVTSAAEHAGRWWALAQIRWDARDDAMATATGVALTPASGS